ncbi:acetolactate synthase small subunit [Anaerotignum neopropionicum]|uniref:Acetolactate synthase small subunit n=1 Tax=Anaerotignum neopropionicum TaxID=36847 RepID=A0A136WBG8_9FIRM|nr:acetolactate synthase small subunit [Anaerotignum neopropionicum]KXL51862.1 acetolactate synthase small subunit [Anaerotignum neopropionicum]
MSNDINQQFAVSIIVSNQSGTLTRISSLFSQRNFNIDSFTCGVTNNPEVSRMTITATGDVNKKEQLLKQITKLYDVKKVELMTCENTILRELLIAKVNAKGESLQTILDAANVFRSKVVDMSPESVCIEMTGESSKLNAFLTYIAPYGILEYCRTGLIAVERGSKCLYGVK